MLFSIIYPIIYVTTLVSSAGAFATTFIDLLLMRTLFNHILSHTVFIMGTDIKETVSPWSQEN